MKNTLKVGTLFSGIGAFEQALIQLNIPHEIKFACDNGEIELIPLPRLERWEYKRLDKKAKSLDEEQRDRYQYLRGKIDGAIEQIRHFTLSLDSKELQHRHIDRIYKMYKATRWRN